MTNANSLDPGLDPNYLTLWWYSWKNSSKKFIFKKINRRQKSMKNYPESISSVMLSLTLIKTNSFNLYMPFMAIVVCCLFCLQTLIANICKQYQSRSDCICFHGSWKSNFGYLPSTNISQLWFLHFFQTWNYIETLQMFFFSWWLFWERKLFINK